MNQSLIHDAAWAASMSILEFFAPLLREEEKRDALQEIYARVKAGMKAYEIMVGRREKRFHPSEN